MSVIKALHHGIRKDFYSISSGYKPTCPNQIDFIIEESKTKINRHFLDIFEQTLPKLRYARDIRLNQVLDFSNKSAFPKVSVSFIEKRNLPKSIPYILNIEQDSQQIYHAIIAIPQSIIAHCLTQYKPSIELLILYDFISLIPELYNIWWEKKERNTKYIPIKSNTELKTLLETKNFNDITFDIETDNLETHTNAILTISFMFNNDPNTIYFIYTGNSELWEYAKWWDDNNFEKLQGDLVIQLFNNLIRTPSAKISGAYIKFDILSLLHKLKYIKTKNLLPIQGLNAPHVESDLSILFYVLYNEQKWIGLKDWELALFGEQTKLERENLKQYSLDEIINYNCEDVFWTYKVNNILKSLIPKIQQEYNETMHELYYWMILAEYYGLRINKESLDKYKIEYIDKYEEFLNKQCQEVLNDDKNHNNYKIDKFYEYVIKHKLWSKAIKNNRKNDKKLVPLIGNIQNDEIYLSLIKDIFNSKKIMSEYIYNFLNYTPIVTDKGNYSCNQMAIEELKKINPHPIFDKLLQWQNYKLYSSRLKQFLTYVSLDYSIYPEWNITVSVTGRIYATRPSPQNLPNIFKENLIENEIEDNTSKWKLLRIDYSQIELRVGASITNSTPICNIYNDKDKDVHLEIAKIVWPNLTEEELLNKPNKEHSYRYIAKTISFGSFYSGNWKSIYNEVIGTGVKIKEDDSKKAFDKIMTLFNGREIFIKANNFMVNETLFLSTPVGKRFYIGLDISDYSQHQLENRLINYPIQFLANWIVIKNLIKVLRHEELSKYIILVGLIHDEYLFVIKEDVPSYIIDLLKEKLEEKEEWMSVPLQVGLKSQPPSTSVGSG